MKKFYLIGLLLCGMSFTFCACSGSDPEVKEPDTPSVPDTPKETITCSTTALNATSEGGEYILEFTASSNWNITVPTSTVWCTVSPASGSAGTVKVKVKTTANDGYDDRNATLAIKCGTATHSVVLTQKQKNALLLTTTKYEVEQKGGTIEVEAKANVSYDVTIAETCKGWITSAGARALSTKKHSFSIAASEEYDKREGEIVFKSADLVDTVKVYQSGGAIFVLTQDEYNVPKAGGDITIELKSNVEYTVDEPMVPWLTKSPAGRAVSSHTLYYTVLPNDTDTERETSLVFRGKNGEQATVKVKQKTSSLDYGELYAFPGAEGHGRYVTGGRGGTVYHVTTLEDDANGNIQGSFRWALKQNGPKTIVFDVAGTIHLKADLKTQKDNLTIAGQTSPGGICLADYAFVINSNNVIIRFMRFRPGDASGKEPDGLGGMDKKNVIVDHCSVSWSVDECLSVYGMENSTVQWCIASQALRLSTHVKKAHCYGGNWGGNKASYHHNLIAHCESRVPRLGPRYTTQSVEYVDIRNNVFYNWSGEGCYGGEAQNVNIVNNYYKPGPATLGSGTSSRTRYRIAKIGVRTNSYIASYPDYKPTLHKWGTYYITDNKMEGNADVTADNWTKGVYEQQDNDEDVDYLWTNETMASIKKESPVVSSNGLTLHSADEAYNKVLAYVGACNYRDVVDELIISDVKNGKASCTASGNKAGYINTPSDIAQALPQLAANPYPQLNTDTSVSVKDSDGDGMPDEWENMYGLNPADKSDGNAKTVDVRGQYTNFEMYLNGLVHSIMEACSQGGTWID